MFWGRFSVAPSSYTKLVRVVYRQRMYLYLVQFSGMLQCWLQRYHARIRTLGSSLVAKTNQIVDYNSKSFGQKLFLVTYKNSINKCDLSNLNTCMSAGGFASFQQIQIYTRRHKLMRVIHGSLALWLLNQKNTP